MAVGNLDRLTGTRADAVVRKIVGSICIALIATLAFAGGSHEPARIVSFRMTSETDYVLVIDLLRNGLTPSEWRDPMFRGCTQLEVHGTYGALKAKGRFAWFRDVFSPPENPRLTKAKHLEAIGYLSQAAANNRIVNFGYMGTGFEPIDERNPCVVASRALELLDGSGEVGVYSNYFEY